jgi:hypothetical protein
MKARYHIVLDGDNWNIFQDASTVLSIDTSFVSKLTSTNGWTQYDYILDLSKYELLYLRLACPMKSLKEITKVEVV